MPLPVGGLPGTSGRSVNPQDFANLLNQKWPDKRINDPAYPGNNLGDQWLAWYAKHPGLNLSIAENGFLEIIALEDLKGGLQAAAEGTAVATGQIAQGTATGLSQYAFFAPFIDFFGRLTEKATWIRIAEVGLGVILLAVALDKMFQGTPVGNVSHKALKAAMLA